MNRDQMINILIVEDAKDHREIIADRLKGCEPAFTATFVETCDEALRILSQNTFDCLLVDHNLPDDTGANLLARARYQLLTTPVIAMSTSGDPAVGLDDMLSGSATFIRKRDAFTAGTLRETILGVIEHWDVKRRLHAMSATPLSLDRMARALGRRGEEEPHDAATAASQLHHICEAAVQVADVGIVVIESREHVVFINPALRRMLGLDPCKESEIYPKMNVNRIFQRESMNLFQQRNHVRTRYQARLCNVDGDDVPVMITETWVGEDAVLCAVTDLREIDRHQRLIEQANRKLIRSARVLRSQNRRLRYLTETAHRFVENVAHEFRTPLAVIHEFASIIGDGIGGPTTHEQREYTGFISAASLELSRMVDDFLDSSKLKAGTLRIERRPYQVAALLAAIRPMVTNRAQMKHVKIVESIPAGLPQVFIDMDKASRALVNLLINAIKFSPEHGEVRIAVTHHDGDIEIAVTDHGPGLDAEDLRMIGERFRQCGDPMKGTMKGFGLGINIAKELVWLNLGQMQVDSRPGEGACFSFTLPIHDNSIIISRYIRLMHNRRKEPHLVALTIDCSEVNMDSVYDWLTSLCHPADLVLPNREAHIIYWVGQSRCADRWARQLRASWEKHHHVEADAGLGGIHFRFHCEGSPETIEKALRAAILDGPKEPACHV